jgi:hypothetical protein
MEEYNLQLNSFYAPDIGEVVDIDSIFRYTDLEVKTLHTDEFEDCERQRKASTANEDLMIERRIEADRYECIEMELDMAENRTVTIKTDKYKYIGEVVGELRHGFGICYYNKGGVYIGQWRNDKKYGLGKTLLPDGQIIQGEIVSNYYEGFVEMIVPGKFVEQGYMINNIYIGEVNIKRGGVTVEGKLDDPTANVCKVTYSDTNYYIGEVNRPAGDKSFLSGFGISVAKKNFIYSGYIKSVKSNGYGELFQSDGSRYFGYFKDNKKHGIGFNFTKEGRMTYGYYYEDVKNGPFISFTKSSYKLEMFHLGFRSKIVEKFETCKKYLTLNYPEYSYILKINHKTVYDKLIDVISELSSEILVNEI